MKHALFAIVAFVWAMSAGAQEPPRPWEHPDVVRAALEIRMEPDQRPIFRATVTEFLRSYGADVRKLMLSNNQANLPHKMATKRRHRVRAMDESMAAVLDDGQYPRYETYRDMLLKMMDERAAGRRGRR